jgi:iron(III) transport system substrate-binding protein
MNIAIDQGLKKIEMGFKGLFKVKVCNVRTLLFVRAFMLIAMAAVAAGCSYDGEVVNVYSSRHYDVDQKLLERFTEETGIRVNLVSADSDQLLTRLQNEGERTRADVFITADASRLIMAKQLGLLQKIDSELIWKTVPPQWRDRQFFWTGLTRRVRLIVYHPDRVDESELSGYEALAGAQWKGRVLVRSSASHYNQALMASIIAALGEEAALEWAGALVENMAQSPRGNDRDQVKFIAAGLGDVAIINSYYLGLLHNSPNSEEREVARQVRVHFPNQGGRGSHVNISGAGITAASPNRENAVRLIEFLISVEAQEQIAFENFEYPVTPEASWPELLVEWGTYQSDTIPLEALSRHREQAVMIFNQAGWR